MAKAYLRRSSIEKMAEEAAFHDVPEARENALTEADSRWVTRYHEAMLEITDRYKDGMALPPGGFPTAGTIALDNGLTFFLDGRDWYVDQKAVAIEKVNAGVLDVLGGRRQ